MVFILGLSLGLAVPSFLDWREEQLLDAAASEVCAVIREAEAESRNVKNVRGNTPEWMEICFENIGGRVRYYGKRSAYNMEPRGYLPGGVVLGSTPVILRFYRHGFTIGSETGSYTVQLRTRDKKKGRDVIVALYTGRVHVEKR